MQRLGVRSNMEIEFKDRLKLLMFEKNITKTELSRRANISRSAIGKYLKGEHIPNPRMLQKLADGLDIPFSKLTKPTLKSAKEMLEDLGYKQFEDTSDVVAYEEDFLDYTSILVFFKRHQGIRKYIVCDGKRLPGSIVVTELQAINQMCRELGWLNGK